MSRAHLGFRILVLIVLLIGLPTNLAVPDGPGLALNGRSVVRADSGGESDVRRVSLDESAGDKPATLVQSALYPFHPGYPIHLDKWIEKSSATIADINHDGSYEVLVPTYNSGTQYPGKIYAWTASGVPLPGFPINTTGHLRGQLALGDLNHDGNLEIAAGVNSFSEDIGARAFVWRSDGTLLPGWPQDTACHQVAGGQYCGLAAIMLADVDSDSNLEVIAGTDNRDIANPDPNLYVPNLYVWRNTGQPAAGRWPVEDDHNVALLGAMAVGDLNSDGRADIVTGRDYNRLFAYDHQGYDLPGWPVYVFLPEDGNFEDPQIEFARSAATLADLDGDGTLEYIIAGLRRYAHSADYYNTDLLVYAPNGKRWRGWETPAAGAGVLDPVSWRMLAAPAIGDLDGNKHPEIVVSTQDGWVRAYTLGKELLWGFDYAQGKVIYATETVIGDVDGDGWNEVLFGTFDPYYGNVGPVGVHVLDHNGFPKPDTPLWVDASGLSAAPTLADLDQDGKLEIAAVTIQGKVYVWDAPGNMSATRLPWPMARHDLQRTGLFANPESDLSESAKVASLYTAHYKDTVTYTIHLTRTGAPLTRSIQLTDVIPTGLSYLAGSLTATAGLANDALAPTLSWTGFLSDAARATITYGVTVTMFSTAAISNSALIDVGPAGQLTRTVTLIVNGLDLFLPIVYR